MKEKQYLILAPERNSKGEILEFWPEGSIKATTVTEALRRAKQQGYAAPVIVPKREDDYVQAAYY